MSFGATVFGERFGCRPADDTIAQAKAFGAAVLGAACGIAPPLPAAVLTDTEFRSQEEREAAYVEAAETLNALLVLARKQSWPSDIPVVAQLEAWAERAQEVERGMRRISQISTLFGGPYAGISPTLPVEPVATPRFERYVDIHGNEVADVAVDDDGNQLTFPDEEPCHAPRCMHAAGHEGAHEEVCADKLTENVLCELPLGHEGNHSSRAR